MRESNYQVRRATIDDLAVLRTLWLNNHLPAAFLEKRLTEFQVVETADGCLLGALGLQIENQHGKIHSEAYEAPELADELRARLWERVQSLARTHGLRCVWMENASSAFWLENDFEAAGAESVKKLPQSFGDAKTFWLRRKFRDENVDELALEQELALLRVSQKAESAKLVRRTRALRALATLVAAGATMLMIFAFCYVLRRWKGPL